MEPSATPWRALEDPVEPVPAGPNVPPDGAPGATDWLGGHRSTLLVVGIAVALAVAAFVLAFGSGASGTVAIDGGTPFASPGSDASASGGPSGALADGRILVVEIEGAVARPGVFRLPSGARVGDLVAEAQLITNWEALPVEVAQLIHPHPTQSEAIGEAHLALAGKPLHVHG